MLASIFYNVPTSHLYSLHVDANGTLGGRDGAYFVAKCGTYALPQKYRRTISIYMYMNTVVGTLQKTHPNV